MASRTGTVKLAREIRAEALALIQAIDAWGMPSETMPEGNRDFLTRKIDNIDGISALLREALTVEKGVTV